MTNEIQQLWNTLDQLRHQRHWESEGKHLLSKALADARREALEPWEVWIEKLYELLNDPLKSQTERLIEAEQMVRGWRVPKIREAHWKEYCRQRASEG